MDPGPKSSFREIILGRAKIKEERKEYLKTLLLAKAAGLPVNSDNQEYIDEYNKLARDYKDACWGAPDEAKIAEPAKKFEDDFKFFFRDSANKIKTIKVESK